MIKYLRKAKEKRQIAVDAVFLLKHSGGLDPLPRRCNLDQHALFFDSLGFVQRNNL
jgi:hypothetical protein